MGCTAFVSVGDRIIGQNLDSGASSSIVCIGFDYNEETGINAIGWGCARGWAQPVSYFSALTSEGLAMTSNGKPTFERNEEDFNDTVYGQAGRELLLTAKSAKEWIEGAEKIAQNKGVRAPGAGARPILDKDEFYYLEGGGPGDYGIIHLEEGLFAHANEITIADRLEPGTSYRHYLDDIRGTSVDRAIKAQELLEERGEGNITAPYMFKISRHKEHGFDETYSGGIPGNINRYGHSGVSHTGVVMEISANYPELLSIYWVTPNNPSFSPFIPFFIGMNKIPETFAHGDKNETKVFQDLARAVAYDLEKQEKVQSFWEAFEIEMIRDIWTLTSEVRNLENDGEREKAQQLLYDFVNERCEVAINYAKQLTAWVTTGLPIEDFETDVSIPKGMYGSDYERLYQPLHQ